MSRDLESDDFVFVFDLVGVSLDSVESDSDVDDS